MGFDAVIAHPQAADATFARVDNELGEELRMGRM